MKNIKLKTTLVSIIAVATLTLPLIFGAASSHAKETNVLEGTYIQKVSTEQGAKEGPQKIKKAKRVNHMWLRSNGNLHISKYLKSKEKQNNTGI